MESGANFWESDKHVPEAMQDVPVFVIGNGPSLDDAEELLKHYQNDAIILAAGTALGSLLKMGIQPDFHVLIERPRRNYDILVDTLPKEEYAKLNLLSTNVIYEDTPKLYKWSGLALKGAEAGSDYYALLRIGNFKSRQDIIPYSNPLVANTAMSFASSFGFKNIYLFGVDNGTPESGEHHSKYSIYNDKSLKGKYKAKGGYKHKVKGNLGGTVLANSMYMISRFQMEQLVAYRPEANFYNVGQGAYIKGAYPLKEEDVVLESLGREKQQLVEEIKATQFSPNTVIDEDYKVLDLDAFEEIGNNILSITEEEFSTREECADILRRQARYVYSLRGGRYTHYYHLFKGSLLYYHCPLITLLYSYEDDDFTIAKTKEAMKMWNDYIKDILQDFPKNYKTKCDWGLE